MSKKTAKPVLVQIRLLTSVARKEDGRLRSYQPGDVYECSPEEAERRISKFRAEALVVDVQPEVKDPE